MASLVLGVIGAAIPVIGPVAGVIGAAVGGVIDTLVINAIQRSQLPTPQPPDILRHSAADEGIGAPWIQGGEVRIPGAIIFLSDVKTINIADSAKGKGPDNVEYAFKADIAIAWCRNETFGDIKKIWASGELIYISGDQTITETGECNIKQFTEKGIFDVDQGSPPLCPPDNESKRITKETITYEFSDQAVSSAFVSQFSFIQNQQLITISGAGLSPANAGTFVVQGAGSFIQTGTGNTIYKLTVIKCEPKYDDDLTDLSTFCVPRAGTGCSPGIDQVNIVVTWLQIVLDPFSPYFEGLPSCYKGDNIQGPDPLLETHLGTDKVPAFRGTTYCVLKQMDLTKWAGTVPAFEAWVEETVGPKNIEDVMKALVARAEGFDLDWLDVSQLEGLVSPIITRGLFLIGPSPPSEMMDQLLLLYDLEVQEVSVIPGPGPTPQPRMQILQREATQTISIPASDLGARAFGEQGSLGPQIVRATKEDLPQEIILDFIVSQGNDNLNTFPPSTVSYSVVQSAVRNQQKLTVSVTMFRNEADARIRAILWALILRHDRIAFEIPPSYTNVLPGDRAFLTLDNGSLIQCRMTQVDRGENGLIKVQAQLDDSSIYSQTGGTYSLPPTPQPVAFPPFMAPVILDLPPLTAAQASTFGLTVAIQTSQSQFPFPGGALFTTQDDVIYNFESSFTIPAITGRSDTRLQPGLPYFWDDGNTVDVVIDGDGTLSNATEQEVSGGVNWAYLGGEIFGFRTATLIDSNSYTLSGLIRGRRNTEQYSARQSPENALFVLLGDGATFFDLEPSAFNTLRTVRAVPSGESVEDQDSTSDADHRPIAQSLKPFSVHGLWAVRQADSAVCLWCTPRTRVPYRIFSSIVPPPTVEPQSKDNPESFKAIVFRANAALDDWVEMRTIPGCFSANSQIAFSYSRKEQITDAEANGFDPNIPSDWLKFDIRRDSNSIGTGRLRTFCMQGNGVKFETADCSVIA